MTKTFWVYVDRDGKMPQLQHKPWESVTHPYYIRYINDRPVAYHGPRELFAGNATKDKVWCYLTYNYVSIDNLTAE